jgi:hypothetical protein
MKIQQGELKQAKEFISTNFIRLVNWSIGDIKKCCRMREDGTCEENGSLVGSFILWCCAIDFFGGLFTGRATRHETERRFNEFVNKYMNNYDYKKLIDLRWALLHFYTSRHFAFHQSNNICDCKQIHLTNSNSGIVMDLYCSIRDLENAVKHYQQDLEQSEELQIRLFRYFKVSKTLMPIKIEYTLQRPLLHITEGGAGVRRSGNSAGTTIF